MTTSAGSSHTGVSSNLFAQVFGFTSVNQASLVMTPHGKCRKEEYHGKFYEVLG